MKREFRPTESTLVLPLSCRGKGRNGNNAIFQHEPIVANAGRLAYVLPAVCILLLTLFATPQLEAQIATGGVTGTVKDASGAVISDVQVSLKNDQTTVVQDTHSTSTGTYVFESVPVGTYTLQFAHSGFQDLVINNIMVHVQFVLTQDVILPVGSAQQQVTVTASAPLLQAESRNNRNHHRFEADRGSSTQRP